MQIIFVGFVDFRNEDRGRPSRYSASPLLDYRNGPFEHDPRVLAKACCEMSRRDDAIVAWHEVPKKEFGHLPKALMWLKSCLWPEGPGKLSPGFTLGNAPQREEP